MRYKTKPFEIEAVQYVGGDYNRMELWKFAGELFNEVDPSDRHDDPENVAEIFDKLHSTWVGVRLGQWIIKGMKGEFYPCDDEVFRTKYEAI